MLHYVYQELPKTLRYGMKGMKRVRHTTGVLTRTGLEWVFGDRPKAPALLRRTFERMGATYIKLGQVIASSPSLFPEDYIDEFKKCLDQTEPIPFKTMRRILVKELGNRKIRDMFAEIDPEPLASASIAQVYGARLASGEDVVIKIQRPGVEEILVTDMVFLQTAAQVFERIVPRMRYASISGILSEMRRSVLAECDFLQESENMELFSDFLKRTDNRNVVTPRVYPEATTRRVLTMERLYGIQLTDREAVHEDMAHASQAIVDAFETWFESITRCPVFHADLHAGNLLLLYDGRVGFIDFGVVSSLSYQTKSGMKLLIESLVATDFRKMARALVLIGLTGKRVNRIQLEEDLREFYESFAMPGPTAAISPLLPEGGPDRFLSQMIRIGEKHGIHFPPEFTLLLKQFFYFDSYRELLMQSEQFFSQWMEEMAGNPDDW